MQKIKIDFLLFVFFVLVLDVGVRKINAYEAERKRLVHSAMTTLPENWPQPKRVAFKQEPIKQQQLVLASTSCLPHIVAIGDTMSGIAKKGNISLRSLLAMNPQVKAPKYVIVIGNPITVPCNYDFYEVSPSPVVGNPAMRKVVKRTLMHTRTLVSGQVASAAPAPLPEAVSDAAKVTKPIEIIGESAIPANNVHQDQRRVGVFFISSGEVKDKISTKPPG